MIHPPKQDESRIRLQGNPNDSGFRRGALEKQSLFLGDVSTWPDKNDAFCVNNAYPDGARVTCLTKSKDRYHFWADYAAGRDGVCLWFNKNELISGLKNDSNLEIGWVKYPTRNKRTKKLKLKSGARPANSAFVKREQYADEREFRIIRPGLNGSDPWIEFPKSSLKRIYLNAWMPDCCRDSEKVRIESMLAQFNFGSKLVIVQQNCVLDHVGWQSSVRDAFTNRP